MTTYTKITDYASKDALLTGNPSKVVRGTEIDAEFAAIASADADSVKTSALGTGVATFLATPSSANLAAAVTGETGSGALVFGTSPTLVTPALGTPSALVGTNITGTAAGLTAGSVTTNANLTGPITSVGNATSIASQTGTGTKFVVDTSPTLVTPNIGVATGTSFQGIIGNVTPAAGTFTTLTSTGNLTANGQTVGYLNIPQNSQSAAYTLVLADAGKHILHPSADTTARIFTIPANASVAFPIGTAVTFVNQASGGVITIAITTDTMRLAGAGTTGSRTLAANGVATAVKLTATEWIISGTNLT